MKILMSITLTDTVDVPTLKYKTVNPDVKFTFTCPVHLQKVTEELEKDKFEDFFSLETHSLCKERRKFFNNY